MHYKKLLSIILSASLTIGTMSGLVFADEPEVEEIDLEPDTYCEETSETEESLEEDGIVEEDEVVEETAFEEEDEEEPEEIESEEEPPAETEEEEAEEISDGEAIQITDTLFKDQDFRTYVSSSEIDADEDGFLSSDEISAVTSMDISGRQIYDLSGIEVFTALEVLDCHNNSLCNIDLSQNPNIKKLYCQDNLVSCKIDISGNSNLKTVLGHNLRDRSETVYYKFATDDCELIFSRNAAIWTEDTILMGIEYYGGKGNDTTDDYRALSNCCWEAVYTENGGRSVVIIIPSGTYYLSSKVKIFSNTSIYADDDATIISTSDSKGAMIDAEHTVSATDLTICKGDTCTHGGYSNAHDITISGGTWDRGADNTTYQTAVFIFRHCKNILIENMTMLNCTDHFLNVSGCKGVTVSHVTFKDAQLTDAFATESSYYTIEAIHTDYTNTMGENSEYAMPFDNTPTINVSVNFCTFDNVMAGIGTHHPVQGARAHDYVINNNTFVNIHSYCLSAEGFDTVLFENNTCTSCNSIVVAKDCTNVTIRNNTQTKLYSGSTIDTGRDMIYFLGVRNSTISNNVINNSRHTGIKVASGSSSVTIENNTINKSSEFGIMLQATDAAVSDISVLNNTINGTNTSTSAQNFSGIRVLGLSGTVLLSGNHILATNTARSDSDGIFASDTPGIQITNNDIANVGRRGISLKNCDTCTITGNTITSAAEYGIMMEASADNQTSSFICKNNTVSAQGNYAISVKYCKSVTLDGNTITKAAQQAIFIKYCATSTIKNNTISGAGSTGIWVDADADSYLTKCTCSGNTIKSPGQFGIFIRYCKTAVVEGNTVNNPKDKAICLKFCTSCTVKTNVIKNPAVAGIWVEGGETAYMTQCVVEGNTVESSSQYGIFVRYYKTAVAEENTVNNSKDRAICLKYCTSCTVKTNVIKNPATAGIWIEGGETSYTTKCVVEGNSVESSTQYGIYLKYCKNGTVEGNTVKTSTDYGIFVRDSSSCTVKRNQISDSGKKDIIIHSTCTNCTSQEWHTGWVQEGGKWYYYDSESYMQYGWKKLSGKWYYFDKTDGSMASGWKKISGKWYLFSSGGVMKTGWQESGGKWYYFLSDGSMKTGWIKLDGKWYHFDGGGAMQTSWQKLNNNWYCFGSNGAMKTGWYKTGGKWYYFNADGIMQTGKVTIDGKVYKFDSNGVLIS